MVGTSEMSPRRQTIRNPIKYDVRKIIYARDDSGTLLIIALASRKKREFTLISEATRCFNAVITFRLNRDTKYLREELKNSGNRTAHKHTNK